MYRYIPHLFSSQIPLSLTHSTLERLTLIHTTPISTPCACTYINTYARPHTTVVQSITRAHSTFTYSKTKKNPVDLYIKLYTTCRIILMLSIITIKPIILPSYRCDMLLTKTCRT